MNIASLLNVNSVEFKTKNFFIRKMKKASIRKIKGFRLRKNSQPNRNWKKT